MGMEVVRPNRFLHQKVTSLFTNKDYYNMGFGKAKIVTDKHHGSVSVDEKGAFVVDGAQNAKIKGGWGSDDITVKNSTVTELKGGWGHDKITVENSDLNAIYGNIGRDLVHINNSYVQAVDLGLSSDTLTSKDSKIDDVKCGWGKDTVESDGGYTGTVDDGAWFRREKVVLKNDPINPTPLPETN